MDNANNQPPPDQGERRQNRLNIVFRPAADRENRIRIRVRVLNPNNRPIGGGAVAQPVHEHIQNIRVPIQRAPRDEQVDNLPRVQRVRPIPADVARRQHDEMQRVYRRYLAHDGNEDEVNMRLRRRHHIIDHLPFYVKQALRDRKKNFKCPICNQNVQNVKFLNHVPDCAKDNNSSFEERERAICLFKMSNYYVGQAITRLREQIEIQYLDATIDPARRAQMACKNCESKEVHLDGACMNDNLKSTFFDQAKVIVQKAMSEYSNYMELEETIRLAQVTAEYSDESEENAILTEPMSDLEHAQHMLMVSLSRNSDAAEQNAKQAVSAQIDAMIRGNYYPTQENFMRMVKKQSKLMKKYILENKVLSENQLKAVVQYRKANNMKGLTEERDATFNMKINGMAIGWRTPNGPRRAHF